MRKWDGWYRHTTLSLLAHAYLAVLRSAPQREEGDAKRGNERGTPGRVLAPS